MIIRGVVTAGRSLGRKLGFPTANIALPKCAEQLSNGVYLSRATIEGRSYAAVANIGVKPTAGASPRGLECHILDFEGDLYGCTLEVELLDKLRDELHFESLEALQSQIALDVAQAKNLRGVIKNP